MSILRGKPKLPATGAACTIDYAVEKSGDMPARSFVEDELTSDEQAKMAVLFQWLADKGKLHNKEKFKKLVGSANIYEFKHKQIRIGCFQSGRNWFLTHGFRKKRLDWPKVELARAERIREEHITRKPKLRPV